MAGVLKVDSINADSNLALKIANTAVAFIDSTGLRPVSGNVSLDATATSKVFLPSANTVAIQTAGVTGLSMSSSQVVTLANALPVGSGGTGATSLSSITVGTANAVAGANVSGTVANATLATTSTNLAGGSNGTIPYQSASGTTQMLAAGTSGYVLQANGVAAPTWVAPSTGSWVTLGSGTVSGSPSTIDFETGFTDTTYSAIVIMLIGLRTGSSSGNATWRFKQAGSYAATGYDHQTIEASSSSIGTSLGTNNSGMTLSALQILDSSDFSDMLIVKNRFSTSAYGPSIATYGIQQQGGVKIGICQGARNTGGAVQGARLYLSGGGGATTFASGSYVWYGIKAS